MLSTVDVLLIVGTITGGVICWLGYRVSRLPTQLGKRWFVVFCLSLGVGCIVTGVAGLVPSLYPSGSQEARWLDLPLLFWLVSTLPWFMFILQYTGLRTAGSRRTALLVGLPFLIPFSELILSAIGFSNAVTNALATAAFVYIISLATGGTYLLVQKTYSYGHIPLGQALSLGMVPLGSLTLWNLIGILGDTLSADRVGVYAAGAGVVALGIGAALFRYELFELTPSIGTLGERGLTREADDLMFVIDGDNRIIKINETALGTLGTTRAAVLGNSLSKPLAHDFAALQQAETVAVQTTQGTRQYDPQVSTLNDQYGNTLGATVSLRDVTDRELREQRLAVLNRVLRHNLRNQVDIVKGHAETLDTGDPESVEPILEAADSIGALGRKAQRIDRYVSQESPEEPVNLADSIETALGTVEGDETDASVTVDVPPSATVVANRPALLSAVESAIDNAVTYAESTVSITVECHQDDCVITVVDDGPGIPGWELDSLEAGTESPLGHSTGLGLWQLKWAVMALNGELSFDTDAGTTVEIAIPDRETES